jgi:hypothetical protein
MQKDRKRRTKKQRKRTREREIKKKRKYNIDDENVWRENSKPFQIK